jgi:hypothetical protein
MSNKITFIDSTGRNLLGEFVSKSDSCLRVKNPTVINIAQADNGQLQVQIIPLFLPEFLSNESRGAGTTWSYPLNMIVIPDNIELESRLIDQYNRITSGFAAATLQENSSKEALQESVVKLFDE